LPAVASWDRDQQRDSDMAGSPDHPDRAIVSISKGQLESLPAFKYLSDTTTAQTGPAQSR
jgi:hypothetical protein